MKVHSNARNTNFNSKCRKRYVETLHVDIFLEINR